jgi:hypothetical protein
MESSKVGRVIIIKNTWLPLKFTLEVGYHISTLFQSIYKCVKTDMIWFLCVFQNVPPHSWALIISRDRCTYKDLLSFSSAGGLSFYYFDLISRQVVEFIYELIYLTICCINLALDHCFRLAVSHVL